MTNILRSQHNVAQQACLAWGGLLTIVFVGLSTLLPLLLGQIPGEWDEMPLTTTLTSPSVLLPLFSLVVLAGAFVRSRWVLPVVALGLAVSIAVWHWRFDPAASVAWNAIELAGVVVLVWSGWSRPSLTTDQNQS